MKQMIPPHQPDGERLTTFKGFQLSAFQIESVAAIRRGENLLVSAPTGAV